MPGELERIERRLVAVEHRLAATQAQLGVVADLLTKVIVLLDEPTTFPQSTGAVISVK